MVFAPPPPFLSVIGALMRFTSQDSGYKAFDLDLALPFQVQTILSNYLFLIFVVLLASAPAGAHLSATLPVCQVDSSRLPRCESSATKFIY
jgi:hypothetical protein